MTRLVSPRGRRLLLGAAGIACLLLLWQATVPLIGLESYFYPAPLDVWFAFLDLARKGILSSYLADSFGRYVLGVAAGSCAGIAVGLAISTSRSIERLLSPLISFLFAIVEVAWVPLFVMWFGYGLTTILVALSYVTFFPMLYNTIAGVRTVPPVYLNAARALGASRLDLAREILLPAVLPSILTGLRVGAGFAFRGLIFAEMIAAKSGIGYLIFEGASTQQTARTVVGMIIMGLAWLFIEQVYIRPIERASVERWGMVIAVENR
jgi:NitT/TauT family transport system permease protein/taurine transport system permease protein